jgi:hypothetical protein
MTTASQILALVRRTEIMKAGATSTLGPRIASRQKRFEIHSGGKTKQGAG